MPCSQQKVDNGETVENKTDEIVNKNPTSYFIKEEVTDAEILWALDVIISNYTLFFYKHMVKSG